MSFKVAHSLGTDITAEIVKKFRLKFDVDTVISLGSPLGMFHAIQKEDYPNVDIRDYINGVNKWINLYSYEDLVGYRLGK